MKSDYQQAYRLSLYLAHTVPMSNTLSEFPSELFSFAGVCDSCHRTDWVDRSQLPEEMTIDALRDRLTCQGCRSRGCGIRIVYTGAGEFEYHH